MFQLSTSSPLCDFKIIFLEVVYDHIYIHEFGQAKFGFGVLVFRLEKLFNIAPAASKNDTLFKSSQKRLKNNHFALLL